MIYDVLAWLGVWGQSGQISRNVTIRDIHQWGMTWTRDDQNLPGLMIPRLGCIISSSLWLWDCRHNYQLNFQKCRRHPHQLNIKYLQQQQQFRRFRFIWYFSHHSLFFYRIKILAVQNILGKSKICSFQDLTNF